VGARIEVIANGHTIYRQRKSGHSMEGSNDPRVLIGVGECERIETLIVRWPPPSKVETVLKDVETNQFLELVEPEN
jgi:hypothetical protein